MYSRALFFLIAGLACFSTALAQPFVFTKITDSQTTDLNGSTINAAALSPALEGDYIVFRSLEQNSGRFDGIWAFHIPTGSFQNLADLNDAVPGGTGNFNNFNTIGTSPGGPALRDGNVIFGGTDQGSNPFSSAPFGIFSVAVTGGEIRKIANYQTPVPMAPTDFFNFGEDSRNFGSMTVAQNTVVIEGTYGGGPIGGTGLYSSAVTGGGVDWVGDSDHPWNPAEVTPVRNFLNPATNGSDLALIGGTVFGYFGLFHTMLPSPGPENFTLLVGPGTPLPGATTPNDDTRLIAPGVQYAQTKIGFIGRDISSDTIGIYSTAPGAGITKLVDSKTPLVGIGPFPNSSINPFSYDLDENEMLFFVFIDHNNQGLFYRNAAGVITKVTDNNSLTVDGIPAYDIIEVTPYALDNGRFVFAYNTITFPRSVLVLATPFSQSSDLTLALTAAPTVAAVGETASFLLTIQNNGPAPAEGVLVKTGFTPDVTPRGLRADTENIVNVGTLGVGGSVQVQVDIAPQQAGELSATFEVRSTRADSNTTNNFLELAQTVLSSADKAKALVAQVQGLIPQAQKKLPKGKKKADQRDAIKAAQASIKALIAELEQSLANNFSVLAQALPNFTANNLKQLGNAAKKGSRNNASQKLRKKQWKTAKKLLNKIVS